jgi:hypothetical protein
MRPDSTHQIGILVAHQGRVLARKNTRAVVYRLTDQMAWSAGFFLFNMAVAFTSSVSSYAAVTVACAFGLIAAACVRAYALDGLLVAGATARVNLHDSFSRRVVWISSVVCGAIASAFSVLWIWLSTGETPNWSLIVLPMAIVAADAPHYLLTMKRAYNRALRTGSLYLLGGLFAIFFGKYLGLMAVMMMWVASTSICTLTGWLLAGNSVTRRLEFPYRHVSRRMGAEALYSALGGQLGIFLIYLTSDPSATAGIRLAYSLVFAPAFMIIQGLTPLYLLRMSDLYRQASIKGIQLTVYWISASCLLLAFAGICGFVAVVLPFSPTTLTSSVPYLVPVGLSIMGSICFDAALLGWRFRVNPKFPHRARLGTVAIDLAAQATGILVAGPQGLVVALISMAALKAIFGTFLILKLRSRPPDSASPVHSPTREESGVANGA